MLKLSENEFYRYERKFVFDADQSNEIDSILTSHPFLFSECFPTRDINNIYFDTESMHSYFDNIEGNSYRVKYRIRWYGNLFGEVREPKLEIKVKDGVVGTKVTHRVVPFHFDDNTQSLNLKRLTTESALPRYYSDKLRTLRPVLINRYTRKYYLSKDKKYRITIDCNLHFSHFKTRGTRTRKLYRDSHDIIMELKYAPDSDVSVERVSSHFPYRLNKCSKYVRGVEHMARVSGGINFHKNQL